MPNNLQNSEKNISRSPLDNQDTKFSSRKEFENIVYKKITKKDFVMALTFSFMFVF
jgi:hypothetical protein